MNNFIFSTKISNWNIDAKICFIFGNFWMFPKCSCTNNWLIFILLIMFTSPFISCFLLSFYLMFITILLITMFWNKWFFAPFTNLRSYYRFRFFLFLYNNKSASDKQTINSLIPYICKQYY